VAGHPAGRAPGDPDVILRSTDGGLIDVSRDEGATWTPPAGLPAATACARARHRGRHAHRLPGAHALDGVIQTKKWGVYRSTNGAQSFDKVDNLGAFPATCGPRARARRCCTPRATAMLEVSTDKGDQLDRRRAMNACSDAS
jgi:hypothetical protein